MKANRMTINEIVEKQIREELGAARLESIKQRAMIAAQAGEIARLKEQLALATEKGPELPLMRSDGVANGAHH